MRLLFREQNAYPERIAWDDSPMKRAVPFLVCMLILASPRLLMACGGCTDAALRMTLPWAGSGILLVWSWILAAFVTGRFVAIQVPLGLSFAVQRFSSFFSSLRGLHRSGRPDLGSFLLPSLLLGFIWFVYLIVRLLWDTVRFIRTRSPEARTPLILYLVFLVITIIAVVYGPTRL